MEIAEIAASTDLTEVFGLTVKELFDQICGVYYREEIDVKTALPIGPEDINNVNDAGISHYGCWISRDASDDTIILTKYNPECTEEDFERNLSDKQRSSESYDTSLWF